MPCEKSKWNRNFNELDERLQPIELGVPLFPEEFKGQGI
jgi:hypothetical protein